MCAGPEIAAAIAAMSGTAAGAGVAAPGMAAAAAADSALIGSGMAGMAGGMGTGLLGSAAGAVGGKAGSDLMAQMAMQQGMGMMSPQKPPMPQAPPPQQGQLAPMPNPYGSPAGNSLGEKMPMSEEEKMRLRAMGIRV